MTRFEALMLLAVVVWGGSSAAWAQNIATLPDVAGTGAEQSVSPGASVRSKFLGRADIDALLLDPAIRSYVGLAENDWDFNAPSPVLGFGPHSTN